MDRRIVSERRQTLRAMLGSELLKLPFAQSMSSMTWTRWCGVAIASSLAVGSVWISPAHGQLRTGRESEREYYESEPANVAVAPTKVSKTTKKPRTTAKSEVVQASAKMKNRTTEDSHVVQAACKNCQAGVAHSHGPIASEPMEEYAEDGVVTETGIGPDVYDANSFVLGANQGAGCQACDRGPDINITIQPPGFIGFLLSRSHLRIEAATFWPEGQNLPQLVTSRRPANDPALDGLIGRTDTVNLFGGSRVLNTATQGLRGDLRFDLDAAGTHGLLFRFYDPNKQTLSYNSTPTSESVVMRPFFSTANNTQATIAVNYPASTSGSLDARLTSELYGGDILFRRQIVRDCAGSLDFLAGYQTARLADNLLIDSTTTALTNTTVPTGTISHLTDHFNATNRFNGFALGLGGIVRERAFSLSGMFKLGMGNMERSVGIDGSSTITVPGTGGAAANVSTTPNGLLARNTNDGNYTSNTFVVTPEANITLGYRLTRRLEATIGYNYLQLPKVARVGDQLDPNLASNLSNPPTGASTPSFSLKQSNFELHSLNYGLQWRY